KDRTTLQMVPLTLGLKYIFDYTVIRPYLGAGIVGSYAQIHDRSPYVPQKQSDWGVGGIAKSGLLTYLSARCFVDFFIDYTYLKMDFDHTKKNVIYSKADLSGISIGGGLGYQF
ncbi:MAG: hypothetical protein KAR79_04845, partial [Simkaniaceae bacterium]|nr:hypothetical protein [Simkaniaceae bacterium]